MESLSELAKTGYGKKLMTELANLIKESAEKPTEQLESIIVERTKELGSFTLALIYTVGHIFIAILCATFIFNASFNLAAIDAFIEPIINGFWFYLLLVVLKKIIVDKINYSQQSFLKADNIGIYLAILYTFGHIFIAMTCNRLLTGAPLNLAALDAIIEPIINGFWFYLFFEVFSNYKLRVQTSAAGRSSKNPSSLQSSKFAPINNKNNLD